MAYQCAFCGYIIYASVCKRCKAETPKAMLDLQERNFDEYLKQSCPSMHEGAQCCKPVNHTGKCASESGVTWLTEFRLVSWRNCLGGVENGRVVSSNTETATVKINTRLKLSIPLDRIFNG